VTLTATAIQYPEPTATLWSAPPENAQHVCRITVGVGQQIWLGDEDVDVGSQLPGGAVWINAPLAAKGLPGNISMTPGLTTGEKNISTATYKFLDDRGDLDAWLQGKAANALQVFGGTLEHFIIERGEPMQSAEELNRALWYTWQIKGNVGLDNRIYNIRCEDISRDAERDIFEKRSHTLMSGLESTAGDVFIYLTDAEAEDLDAASWVYEHASDYHVHPGEYRAIGLLSDGDGHEYISWTGLEDSGTTERVPGGLNAKRYRLVNPQRGLFGTIPRQWTYDSSKPLSSRRKIEAVPYAEEHPLSLFKAAHTGITLDGRLWPWGLNIDPIRIDTASLSAAAMDSYQLRITVRSPEVQTAKRFGEEHCLARRGIAIVNPSGALSYVAAPIGTGVPVITLNEDNCYGADSGDFVHDESDTATATSIQWDKNPITGEFRKTTEFREPAALGETSATEPETFEAPYLTTNRSTEGEVYAQGRVLHARHARPVKRITLKPDWSLAHYAPGTVAQVELPIIDYAVTGSVVGNISMPMMIASISRDHHSEKLSWKMIGFRPLPSALTDTQSQQLPEAEYIANGIPLTVNNGIASVGQTIDLTKKYYHLGDVTLPSAWPLGFGNRGDVELWVRGILLWGADVDLTGRGGRGGNGSTGSGEPGERGSAHAPVPTGSVSVSVRRFENSSGDPQGIVSRRTVSRPASNLTSRNGQTFTHVTASVERGRIVGLPARLMGSGGSGGDGSSYRGSTEDGDTVSSDNASITGSDGGHGAAGVKIICSAGSGFVGNGAIRLNGLDGDAPAADKNGVIPAAGAGGAFGRIAVFHDTPGTPWQFDGTTLEARSGVAVLQGSRAELTTLVERGSLPTIRSFYQPPQDPRNKWAEAYTVQFLPPSELLQDADTLSLIDEFFSNQGDGSASIIVGDVDPSDGNLGDLLISQAALDSNEPEPAARVFSPEGWRDIDWDTEKFSYIYAGLILRKRQFGSTEIVASETRPNKPAGTVWFQPSTQTEWLLGATSADDVLLSERQVPQGEDMIDDLSFAKSGAGEKLWAFTRNAGLSPINVRRNTATGSSNNGGGSTATSGITLTDQGRTVAGTAYQDNGGAVIAQGRQGTVTLADATQLTFSVGAGGAFSVTFPSTNDSNLGQQASVYTQNAAAGTAAQLNFTYEL